MTSSCKLFQTLAPAFGKARLPTVRYYGRAMLLLLFFLLLMGVDHGGPPQNLERGDCPPRFLSCCKILSTRLLALQCRKMCFLPLQQDFYSKSRHASPQNSSQIYAYAFTYTVYLSVCLYVSCLCLWALLPDLNKMIMMMTIRPTTTTAKPLLLLLSLY